MKILLYNAKVLTQDHNVPVADTIYIIDNTIRFVGWNDEFNETLFDNILKIDLKGKIVLPGFIDCHTHFINYAFSKRSIDLTNADTPDEITKRLTHFIIEHPDSNKWIHGIGWDKNLWEDPSFFNKDFLDKIIPNIPVSLSSKDLHSFLCNSKALQLMNITSKTPDPPEGSIGRDSNGSINGFLYEKAWKFIDEVRPNPVFNEQLSLVKNAINEAHHFGLTGINSMEGKDALKIFSYLKNNNQLKLRTCWHFRSDLLEEMIDQGVESYTGDEWFKFGGLKLFMDGSIGSHTAYMFNPYFGDSENYGILFHTEDELHDIVLHAAQHNISPTIHAIGDKANHLVISSIIKVKNHPEILDKDLLYRIEHVQCCTPQDQKRIAVEGIYCSMQPIHISLDVKTTERLLGKYGKNSYPVKSLLDKGAIIGFGSDVPVETHNPFMGIYSALERKYHCNPNENSWIPEQKITVQEAIKAYTINAAKGMRNDDYLGSITPGKHADLIVIDDFENEPNEFWLEAKPYMTIVGGEIVVNNL
ncbi:MAG TPA: amidohydrolase [Candidatus Cloacimonetes bacterium]|nr:amidohydrolase [Candidatus Cloacimonadota bacterium]HEX37778.1 amidohydrolase [Candidatus Cloacimonadota bacterium]